MTWLVVLVVLAIVFGVGAALAGLAWALLIALALVAAAACVRLAEAAGGVPFDLTDAGSS